MLVYETAESPQFVSVDDYLAADVKSQTRNEYVEGWVLRDERWQCST